MRKAVKHPQTFRSLANDQTVALLIQKVARLLAVFDIDVELQTVFINDLHRRYVRIVPGAFIQLKSFLCSRLDIIALINAADLRTVCAHHIQKNRIDVRLDPLHAGRCNLADENIVIAVHGQSRKKVCIAEYNTAVAQIVSLRHLPVVPGRLNSSSEERFIKDLLRIQ